MATLLVEVGTEEVPAAFVSGALEALPEIVRRALDAVRLGAGEVRVYGTPRRIAFTVDALDTRQPDKTEEVTGPPAKAAMGPDGKPTKAGEGFAKKMGVAPEDLRIVETPKGPYVAATRTEIGRSAREVLVEALPALLARLPFPKSMRWEVDTGPFARPVQWVLARLDGEVVPFAFAGRGAAGVTFGHRFLSPGPLEVHDPREYLAGLRAAHVLADPSERRTLLVSELERAASAAGTQVVPDDALLEEVTFLVEEPHAVVGSFDPALLALPRAVILSSLRGHQRCFALADAQGGLAPSFLAVAQTCEDPARVRRGNERVIRARLADAQFFFEQDKKHRLEERQPALEGMTFQARLGTMADRARRAAQLASWLVGEVAAEADAPKVLWAATLAKCDLATQMVGEFPDLQGEVGADYAAIQGEAPEVVQAIREQYLPRGSGDALPESVAGALLSLADRLVVLAGAYAAGLQPTGAADPFGLRRACIGAIRILWDRGWSLSLRKALAQARWQPQKGKIRPEDEVDAALVEFFAGRVRSLLEPEVGVEIVEACLAASNDDLVDLRRRIQALAGFRGDPDWTKLAIAFRRAWNITKDVTDTTVDPALLELPAEKRLLEAVDAVAPAFAAAVAQRDYRKGLALFGQGLKDPIDTFFTEVFVMVEDERVRTNRLHLLRRVVHIVRGVAHLHLLGGEA